MLFIKTSFVIFSKNRKGNKFINKKATPKEAALSRDLETLYEAPNVLKAFTKKTKINH